MGSGQRRPLSCLACLAMAASAGCTSARRRPAGRGQGDQPDLARSRVPRPIRPRGERGPEGGGKFTARVVDADTGSEELWLATEYISGPTLREAVADQGRGRESVLSLAAGLAEALGAIHAAGLVHRDLKPDDGCWPTTGPG